MLRRIFFTSLLLTIASSGLQAQTQELQLAACNLGFSSLSAATGAVINMPRGGNWRKYFLKGLWQGATGGAIAYAGKRSLYLVNRYQNLGYALPARILHFAGLSIIESAAQNKPLLRDWHLSYGPVRADVSLAGRPRFRARLLPKTILDAWEAGKIGTFNLPVTLLTGDLAFSTEAPVIMRLGEAYDALSFGRAFAYVNYRNTYRYELIAHELVHNFQNDEGMIYNSWLMPMRQKAGKTLYRIFNNYVYLDIPYFDTEAGFEYYTSKTYNDRYFEFEAYRISTGKYVTRR